CNKTPAPPFLCTKSADFVHKKGGSWGIKRYSSKRNHHPGFILLNIRKLIFSGEHPGLPEPLSLTGQDCQTGFGISGQPLTRQACFNIFG
ncbi:MAG: hypothetical protein PHC50_04755, partial [Candidatus Cloacimonetes bacterium]|nr:hypothetical protein [Candidatus Cloacimonadota bacterium]